ncbi:hypothetical protein QYM36_015090 [Artemia franciscana]|uniref:Uncharacterized protein n=1 Tax=Artemia franciscana TaxID=6661 RepID=A0AA88L496_ARTSF|nr:hypothetical protein QYM36_015090 [Artemia franciscana]
MSVYYLQAIYRLTKKERGTIDCNLTIIITLLVVLISNFEQGVCLVARCLMLGFPGRVITWSNKKILAVSLSTSSIIVGPFWLMFYDMKATPLYQYCSLETVKNGPIRMSKTNAICLYTSLFLMVLLSFIVLKLEYKASKKIRPHAGMRTVNITTAKAQIFITIGSVVITPLPVLITEFVLGSVAGELSIQIVPVLSFSVLTLRYLLPPLMYIVFNRDIRMSALNLCPNLLRNGDV